MTDHNSIFRELSESSEKNPKYIFLTKTMKEPSIKSHLQYLRTNNFKFASSSLHFQEFICELIHNLLQKKIIIDPLIVRQIMNEHENYNLSVDNNIEKVEHYLNLVFLYLNKRRSGNRANKNSKQKDIVVEEDIEVHSLWNILIKLVKYFDTYFPNMLDKKYKAIDYYCNSFKQIVKIKEFEKSLRLGLRISDYFVSNIHTKFSAKLIEKNPVFIECSVFLKNFFSKEDMDAISVIKTILKKLNVQAFYLKTSSNSSVKFQQTQGSLFDDDSKHLETLDKDEENIIGYVDRLGSVTRERPSKLKKLVVFVVVRIVYLFTSCLCLVIPKIVLFWKLTIRKIQKMKKKFVFEAI